MQFPPELLTNCRNMNWLRGWLLVIYATGRPRILLSWWMLLNSACQVSPYQEGGEQNEKIPSNFKVQAQTLVQLYKFSCSYTYAEPYCAICLSCARWVLRPFTVLKIHTFLRLGGWILSSKAWLRHCLAWMRIIGTGAASQTASPSPSPSLLGSKEGESPIPYSNVGHTSTLYSEWILNQFYCLLSWLWKLEVEHNTLALCKS